MTLDLPNLDTICICSQHHMTFALAARSGGSDWNSIKVLRVDNATGAPIFLNDTLNNVKFSTTAWSPDNKV